MGCLQEVQSHTFSSRYNKLLFFNLSLDTHTHTVHIPALVTTAGKTVWELDHTQQQRGKQDASLGTLPVSDPRTRTTARSLKPQPRHRYHDTGKKRHEYNIYFFSPAIENSFGGCWALLFLKWWCKNMLGKGSVKIQTELLPC